MSVEAAERYVAAGAALLDEKGPESWREKVYAARHRLDVGSAANCILGILYGSFWEAVGAGLEGNESPLGIDADEAELLGFDAHYDSSVEGGVNDARCRELRDAWLDEIEPEVNDGAPV